MNIFESSSCNIKNHRPTPVPCPINVADFPVYRHEAYTPRLLPTYIMPTHFVSTDPLPEVIAEIEASLQKLGSLVSYEYEPTICKWNIMVTDKGISCHMEINLFKPFRHRDNSPCSSSSSSSSSSSFITIEANRLSGDRFLFYQIFRVLDHTLPYYEQYGFPPLPVDPSLVTQLTMDEVKDAVEPILFLAQSESRSDRSMGMQVLCELSDEALPAPRAEEEEEESSHTTNTQIIDCVLLLGGVPIVLDLLKEFHGECSHIHERDGKQLVNIHASIASQNQCLLFLQNIIRVGKIDEVRRHWHTVLPILQRIQAEHPNYLLDKSKQLADFIYRSV